MRAASLVLVLILARGLALAGRELPLTPWAIPAFLWHDLLVGLIFHAVDVLVRRPRWMWGPYAAVALAAAVNVPVVAALSSPVTMPMLRAAGAPLVDSIGHYATPGNLAAIVVVLGAAAVLPGLVARVPRRIRPWAGPAAVLIVVAGVPASSRVATLGLHRNAVTAITATLLPRVAARSADGDWRASPFAEPVGEDLTALRGTAARRHVLLVALESTAARYLSSYGAAEDPTPNLTRLTARGLRFEQAYVVYPESIKGLFAVLCSRDPAFDVSVEAHAMAPCAPLAGVLAAAGYRTALFHSGRFDYLGMRAIVEAQPFDVAEDAGAIGGNVRSSFGVDEAATVARMLEWIDALDAGSRFFITYLPIAGHHPYATSSPGPFEGTTDLDSYRNALWDGDRAFGTLVAGLEARGLLDDTVIVAYGDHGEAFGQHDGNFGHTLFLYEENVKVPLIFSGSVGSAGSADSAGSAGSGGSAGAGAVVGRTASVIDIAPTILDLLGLPVPAQYEGASLLVPRHRMALFFTDYAVGWLGLRDGCWKYLFEVEARRSRLFDLCRDPDETEDRSAVERQRVEAYRVRVEAWASARRAGMIEER